MQRVNTGIIGANLNTVCPSSYNSCEIQQDRMVKGRVAIYSNRTISTFSLVKIGLY